MKKYTIDYLDKEGTRYQTLVIGQDGLTIIKEVLKKQGSTILKIWRLGFRPTLVYSNN